MEGGYCGKKRERSELELLDTEGQEAERKGGDNEWNAMQHLLGTHSYNSVHRAYWFTVFLTRFPHPLLFFIPFFLPLFLKKYQLKTNAIGNLTALGSSRENKAKLYEPAKTPSAAFFAKRKTQKMFIFETLILFLKNQLY